MKVVSYDHALALRAALLGGSDALKAFAEWRKAVPFDAIDAEALRLVPLMYRNISALGSEDPVLGRMKGVYRRTWVHNRMRLAAAERLIEILNSVGIATLLLKGAAVLARWTGDSGLRPMDDVDVLVRSDQARGALARLREAGYAPVAMRADRFTDREFHDWHASLLRSPEGIYIDLHWRALMNGPAQDQDRMFWDRAEPIRLADSTTHILAPEDHLYHICAHALSSRDGTRVDWAADAALILRKTGNRLAWDRFVAHARRDGIEFPIRSFVALLNDVLKVPVPRTVHRALRSSGPAVLSRLELALRCRGIGRDSGAANVFLALQDYRRRSASLCKQPIIVALPQFIRAYWRFDTASAALAYALFAAVGRPRRLRPLLVRNARRALLSARDLPDVDAGDIDFSLAGERTDPFIAGWSFPEADGRWTDGREAVLAFRRSHSRQRDLPVRLKLYPFLVGEKRLKVEVWANGHLVDLWRFQSNADRWSPSWRAFTVNSDVVSRQETIELAFVIRTPRSPLRSGLGPDRRRLGLFVQHVCFG